MAHLFSQGTLVKKNTNEKEKQKRKQKNKEGGRIVAWVRAYEEIFIGCKAGS